MARFVQQKFTMGATLSLSVLLIVGAGLGLLGTGCRHWKIPNKVNFQLTRCPGSDATTDAKRTMVALLSALREEKWGVGRLDIERSTIRATKCYKSLPDYCAEFQFDVKENGGVSAKPAPGNRIMNNLEDDLRAWARSLQSAFGEYRCASDEILRNEGGRYGIEL